MNPPTTITFRPDGTFSGLWTESIDMHSLGKLHIERASHIEFSNLTGLWEVTIEGRVVFANHSRSHCIAWEHEYFAKQP